MTAVTAPADVRLRGWEFWAYTLSFVLVMMAASTPSPLYPVYQEKFGFSSAVLTIVFAIYVVFMLAAMLTAGSLSDFAGRRPVMVGALLLEVIAMIVFAFAASTTWLLVARSLQGMATGIVSATVGAAMLDTEGRHRGRAAVLTGVAPSLGLAAGALAAGAFVQFLPAPTALIYWVLVGAIGLSIVPIVLVPETSPRLVGALRSLRPQVSIPRHLRPLLLVAVPGFAAAWGTGGLYLALGPSMVKQLLHVDNHLIGGFAIAVLWVPAMFSPFLFRALTYRRMMVAGAGAMLVGIAGLIGAFRMQASALFLGSTLLIGLGFGILFTGSYGLVAAEIRSDERAQVVATMYVINYIAFSAPVVIAGFLVDRLGLLTAAILVSSWIALQCLIAIAAVLITRHRRIRDRATEVAIPTG